MIRINLAPATTGHVQRSVQVSMSTRYAVYTRDQYRCVYCNCQVVPGEHNSIHSAASLDHLTCQSTSEARGRAIDNSASNLVTCCAYCNSSRGKQSRAAFIRATAERTGQTVDGITRRIRRQRERSIRAARATMRLHDASVAFLAALVAVYE